VQVKLRSSVWICSLAKDSNIYYEIPIIFYV
jgi:hypothetical protein